MAKRKATAADGPAAATAPAEYTVVARRYRPQQFADLVGQEPVAQALANALTSQRVAHAYLFTGARGVGKTSTARILAKGLTRKDPAHADRERFEKLTEREQAVLRLTAQGFSAPEIGERLFISPKTVDTYKQRIGEKLGLTHRSEYVQFALRLGLLAAQAEQAVASGGR